MKDQVNKLISKFNDLKERSVGVESDIKVMRSKLEDVERAKEEVVKKMKEHGATPENIKEKIEDLFTQCGKKIMKMSKDLEGAEGKVQTIKNALRR